MASTSSGSATPDLAEETETKINRKTDAASALGVAGARRAAEERG
jgi:hypothetical protein